MRGLAWNTGERRVTRPRDVGFTSAGPKKYASSVIAPRNSSCRCSGPKMNWRSGAGRSGWLRRKVQPSPTLELSGPLASASYWAAASGLKPASMLGSLLSHCSEQTGWSWRPSPTGRSWRTSMPIGARCAAGPMPESMSSCGEPYAPQDNTSRSRPQLLQDVVLEVLHADHPVALERRRDAWAFVMTSTLPRATAGRRYADAVLSRRPSRIVNWSRPAPSCTSPLWSSFAGMPDSTAAAIIESTSGCSDRPSCTARGPPTAVVAALAARVVLRPPEVRQHVLVAPAVAPSAAQSS